MSEFIKIVVFAKKLYDSKSEDNLISNEMLVNKKLLNENPEIFDQVWLDFGRSLLTRLRRSK